MVLKTACDDVKVVWKLTQFLRGKIEVIEICFEKKKMDNRCVR